MKDMIDDSLDLRESKKGNKKISLKDKIVSGTKKSLKAIDKMSNKVADIFIPDHGEYDTVISGHHYDVSKEVLDKVMSQVYKNKGEGLYHIVLVGVDVYITKEGAKFIIQNSEEIIRK